VLVNGLLVVTGSGSLPRLFSGLPGRTWLVEPPADRPSVSGSPEALLVLPLHPIRFLIEDPQQKPDEQGEATDVDGH